MGVFEQRLLNMLHSFCCKVYKLYVLNALSAHSDVTLLPINYVPINVSAISNVLLFYYVVFVCSGQFLDLTSCHGYVLVATRVSHFRNTLLGHVLVASDGPAVVWKQSGGTAVCL